MSFSKEEVERMVTLNKQISEREDPDYTAPTFLDSPDLKEILEIVEHRLAIENPHEIDTLEDSVAVLQYVSDAYDRMCRPGFSVKIHLRLLEVEAELKRNFNAACEDFESDLHTAVKYVKFFDCNADCSHVEKIVEGCFDAQRVKEIIAELTHERAGAIKHDPIEASDEYLDVIDEVDRLVAENSTMRHFCHEAWSLKSDFLAQKGIRWRSPALMNPHVMFD